MANPRLKEKYLKEIIPTLKEKMKYKSVMQIPRLEKICINQGLGAAVGDKKLIEGAIEEMTAITGQKAVPTTAKDAISNFKLRKGMPIGAKVTLRGKKMYEFFDRFVTVTLPRVRDFRGVSEKSFDGKGNYTLGVKEQVIFVEINMAKVSKVTGMNITFITTTKSDKEAYELLRALGMPFKRLNLN